MRIHVVLLSLTLALLTQPAGADLPGSSFDNGDFENGATGWYALCLSGATNPLRVVDGGSVLTPGHSFHIPNNFYGQCRAHDFEPFDDSVAVLAWSLKVGDTTGAPCSQTIRVYGDTNVDWRVFVNIKHDIVGIRMPGEQTSTGVAQTPTDGEWHLYAVTLVKDLGIAVLTIDNVQVGYAIGDLVNAPETHRVLIGDTAGSDAACGAAPEMWWDDVYYGPALL